MGKDERWIRCGMKTQGSDPELIPEGLPNKKKGCAQGFTLQLEGDRTQAEASKPGRKTD